VLVLLPPSEGKAPAGRRGRPLDLATLSFPALTPARSQVLEALVDLAQGPRAEALTALGLPVGLTDEVDKDAGLLTAGTVPVERLYTGVLYDALGLATLTGAARRRARSSLLVSSALFGAVRLGDRLPSYRLSMDARLPGLGTLPGVWRDPLAEVLPAAAGGGLVLDLRSTSYAVAWRPVGEVAHRTAAVRVLHETRPGDPSSRAIVSHFNKATKGRLLRQLLESGEAPRTPARLAALLGDLGHTVEVEPPGRAGRPWTLDVVVSVL
jgi:uncharacterized protein